MTSMVSLDKLKDYDRSAEVQNLVRDADIEHRELMALAAKEIKRYSIDPLVEENAKLREYVEWLEDWVLSGFLTKDIEFQIEMKRRELGIEASE